MSPASLRYRLILEPKKMQRYEGVTTTGEYVQFDNGYAKVSADVFERVKELPNYGVDFVQVSDRVQKESPVQPKVVQMSGGSEPEQEDRLGRVENDVRSLAHLIKGVMDKLDNMTTVVVEPKQEEEKKTKKK